MLGEVFPLQQTSRYTCSAAALSAVLHHWGVQASESELTHVIGATPEFGATGSQIVSAARRYGFSAVDNPFSTLNQLYSFVPQRPVIANIFSFMRMGQGHFVVITGIDKNYVYLMDPNAPTNTRRLTHKEMSARWLGRGGSGVVVQPAMVQRALSDATELPTPNNTFKAVAVVVVGWIAVVGITAYLNRGRRITNSD
jgi:ABC-type bacteriocin/lantibiotic exporter with double-glycine peptidase domain